MLASGVAPVVDMRARRRGRRPRHRRSGRLEQQSRHGRRGGQRGAPAEDHARRSEGAQRARRAGDGHASAARASSAWTTSIGTLEAGKRADVIVIDLQQPKIAAGLLRRIRDRLRRVRQLRRDDDLRRQGADAQSQGADGRCAGDAVRKAKEYRDKVLASLK